MIVKKPYAFLIKHFRIIHGILFVLLGYIMLKSADISSFFSDYVSRQYFVRLDGLTSMYIDYVTFLAIIVSAILVLIIGAILKLKNKNVTSYIYIFLELIGIFIYYIYMFTVFKNLELNYLDMETVRNLRDISLMAMIPQFIFLFVVLGRTLGFNLKQFDFKKDLEELDIDETDNEEVEVILGNNNYKYARFLRKLLRLTKYFILENKLFVIGCASILALGVSLTIFMNINVYSVEYKENQQVLANSLYYTVSKSYITQKDLKNQIISKGKSYILVEVDIQNKFNKTQSLDRDTFRLVSNGEEIIPIFTLSDKFMDMGTPFSPANVEGGTDKKYIIIFEVKDNKAQDYVLKIKNFTDKSFTSIESRYKDIIIKPVNIDKENNVGNYVLSADLDFKDTILKNSRMIISSYEVGNRFTEDYEYCIKETCKKGKYVVTPSLSGKGNISILKLNTTLEFDESLYMNKHIKYSSDLLEYYGYIEYRSQGYDKKINITKMDIKYNKDKTAYLEVPSDMEEANKIDLIINIRGMKYTINLRNLANNIKNSEENTNISENSENNNLK